MNYLATALVVLFVSACGGDVEVNPDDVTDGGATSGQADASASNQDAGTHDVSSSGDAESAPDMPADQDAPIDCSQIRTRRNLDPTGTASWRYGGGVGYPDAIERNDACMTVVSTYDELVEALDKAAAPDIVYVEDDAEIDLTPGAICIPENVWLVSGRGIDGSAGARLYSTEIKNGGIIRACGTDVRVTGLRIHGPDPGQCPPQWPDQCEGEDRTGGRNCRDCMPRPSGIQSTFGRLEVDNNELAGFTLAAVSLSDSVDHHVHHNDMHHNQRQGLGYGVLLGRGQTGTIDVLVESNRMDYMRHAIAGSGEPGQNYVARNNLVLENANGHVFDMHGEDENTDNGSEVAGGLMLIHGNTILPPDHYALVVRGRPLQGSYLYDNCMARSNASQAALQRFFTGNFFVDESINGASPNQYGQSASDCQAVRWCTSSRAQGPWRYLARSSYPVERIALGDFDGDGISDVFSTQDGTWRWVPGGMGGWQDLNTSGVELTSLRFGDFTGDGKTDVFNANGSVWRVSAGGNNPWQTLRTTSDPLGDLAFGDFDGDGITDVFRTSGGKWQWSRSGTEAWADLNTSTTTLANLAFGDFDGDGKTDVFSTSNDTWRWSRSGSEPWANLNTSDVPLTSLHFADVDGDGKTDVIRSRESQWLYVSGGSGSWQTLRIDSSPASQVLFGDFDGDGADDIFRTGCLGN